jgi:hypothetical protein
MRQLLAAPATALATIKAALDGDEVVISEGVVALTLDGVKRQNVTIRPADGAKVTFAPLVVNRSSGLTFKGFEATTTTGKAVYVYASQNVRIEGFDVHGDPALKTGIGISVRNCTDVAVVGNRIHDVFHGVGHLDSDGLTISFNDFRTLYGDGIRGGGSDRVLISWNFFTDIYRIDANHPDAIQFWTTNTTVAATDIRIEGNVFRKGKGDPPQFIFLKDETGHLPYTGVVVRDNAGLGIMYQGVSIDGAIDPLIENNFTQGSADSIDAGTGKPMAARIILRNSVGGRWRNNFANAFLTITPKAPPTENVGNVQIPIAAAGDESAMDAWLHRNDPPPAPTDPKDAELAALKAQVEALAADLATTQANLATVTTDRDNARAVAASLQIALDVASAKIAAAQAALGAP